MTTVLISAQVWKNIRDIAAVLVDDISDKIQEVRGRCAELQRRVDGDGALATTAEEDDAMYLDAMD